jgi:hypothetical protein
MEGMHQDRLALLPYLGGQPLSPAISARSAIAHGVRGKVIHQRASTLSRLGIRLPGKLARSVPGRRPGQSLRFVIQALRPAARCEAGKRRLQSPCTRSPRLDRH